MLLLPQLPFSGLEGMSPPVVCYIAMENCPMIADLQWFTYWLLRRVCFLYFLSLFFQTILTFSRYLSSLLPFLPGHEATKNIRSRQTAQPSKVDLACHWLMLLPWFLATHSVTISAPIMGQPIMSVISSWSFHVCCSWVMTTTPVSSSYWLVNGYPCSGCSESPIHQVGWEPRIFTNQPSFINISLLVKPPINSMS